MAWTLRGRSWAGPVVQRAKLCGPRRPDTHRCRPSAETPPPPAAGGGGPGQMAPPSPALPSPAGAYPPPHCPCLSPSHTSPPRVRRQGAPALAIPGRSRVPWGLMPLHHWEPCSPSPGWGPLQRSAGVGEMARAKSGHFLSKCFLLSSSSWPHGTRNPSHPTTQAREDLRGGGCGGRGGGGSR